MRLNAAAMLMRARGSIQTAESRALWKHHLCSYSAQLLASLSTQETLQGCSDCDMWIHKLHREETRTPWIVLVIQTKALCVIRSMVFRSWLQKFLTLKLCWVQNFNASQGELDFCKTQERVCLNSTNQKIVSWLFGNFILNNVALNQLSHSLYRQGEPWEVMSVSWGRTLLACNPTGTGDVVAAGALDVIWASFRKCSTASVFLWFQG